MTEERSENQNRSTFREWAAVTTAHGFLDFSQANSLFGKIVWFVLIAISLALMTYQLYTTIDDFSAHKWVSTAKEEPSGINGTKFPSIIICNINRLKNSKVNEYNMSYDMVRFLFLSSFQDQYIIKDENTTAALEFYKWQKAHNLTYLDIFEKMAPKCENIFVEEQCSEGHITPVQTLEYGRCYRWETNELATTWGSRGAKFLKLNTQGWDYVPVIQNNYLIQGLAIHDWAAELVGCINQCPVPCSTRYVVATTSQTTFPSDEKRPELEKWLAAKQTEKFLLKDIIVLEFYFVSLETKLTEYYKAVSLDNLVSNIGGLIGVWAGMSFLTVFQALQYVYKFGENWRRKRVVNTN
uniref:Uncharacterized protein n=1 Tax=Plectus sambesii TaxID=2011161 RepID=A0A914XQ49_9BILA